MLPDLFKNRVLQLAEETVDSLQVSACAVAVSVTLGEAGSVFSMNKTLCNVHVCPV